RKIGPVRTPAMADVARLTLAPSQRLLLRRRLRQMRCTSHDEVPPRKARGEPLADRQLHRAHLECRLALAVGEIGQAVAVTADPGKSLDIAIPFFNIGITDGPVDAVAIAPVRLKILWPPAIGL